MDPGLRRDDSYADGCGQFDYYLLAGMTTEGLLVFELTG
jgi:hypothetical protein